MNEAVQLPSEYQKFIALSRYARWLPEEKRRERWDETVDRYIDYWPEALPEIDFEETGITKALNEARQTIAELDEMPSMRCMMTAGPALARDNVAGFNCAYLTMHRQRAFDELMYILMCGTGVGYSVESQYTNHLPVIAEEHYESESVIVVGDSKIGWSSSLRELISLLYSGKVPKWDLSKVRPAGSPLRTFGGRASGPGPLDELFKFCVNTFRRFAGQRLPPIAVHDLNCKIADTVVVGGVRRSACLSLSDRDDLYMAIAKSPVNVIEYTLLDRLENGDRKYSVRVDDAPYGERSLIVSVNDWESEQLQKDRTIHWNHVHPERALANNSIAYIDTPSDMEFAHDWHNLIASFSGERGIFNRKAAQRQAAKHGRRSASVDYGCNPCSEILLRDRQFCNLTEVVVRASDTYADLERKVRSTTFLGTLQSTQTHFRYLSGKWKQNTEEERLLGVSLTGILDHKVLGNADALWDIAEEGASEDMLITLDEVLERLNAVAEEENAKWADILGIPRSTAICCVKPSGTVSQLVDCASGIHPRYAEYYIRTVRADIKDPLAQFMIEKGFPYEPCNRKPDSTLVFSFPMHTDNEDSYYRDEITSIEHLKLWMKYNKSWCDHKPSITVSVSPGEWARVGAFVYDNFDYLSGISFLPYDGGRYDQAPYQEVDEGEYLALLERMPEDVDWTEVSKYEEADMTAGSHTYACSGGVCEVVDL